MNKSTKKQTLKDRAYLLWRDQQRAAQKAAEPLAAPIGGIDPPIPLEAPTAEAEANRQRFPAIAAWVDVVRGQFGGGVTVARYVPNAKEAALAGPPLVDEPIEYGDGWSFDVEED